MKTILHLTRADACAKIASALEAENPGRKYRVEIHVTESAFLGTPAHVRVEAEEERK